MIGERSEELLAFFKEHHKEGRIGLVGTDDLVGAAIRDAQSSITIDTLPSKWSHAFLMGEIRADGEPYIFESDLEPDIDRPQLRNGAQESRLSKWAVVSVEHAAVLDLGLSAEVFPRLLAAALRLVHEQSLSYPIIQLVGTWWQIVRARVWKANPFDDAMAMYCSSFVRHCYQEAGLDPVPTSIHLSNTAPEHLWQSSHTKERFTWRRKN